ncbi:D-aminopeptidase [Brucellaceae bacterium C25G]
MPCLQSPALQHMSEVEKFVNSLPDLYKGPGGAVAVIQDGEVVLKQCWGYADMASRREIKTDTRFAICSVTKQFTCATLLDAIGEPEVLDAAFAKFFHDFKDELPTVRELCNNQSGLRDYWALTVLCGADPEGEFLPEDARKLLKRMQHVQFEHGTRFSYNNGNFRIVDALIEQHTGRSLIELMRERIFTPANMKTAELRPDTGTFTECTGYVGDITTGFKPAVNRIYWSGDAGMVASLDDMIAWEVFIDKTRNDENGIYRRLSRQQFFADGSASPYGMGLKSAEAGSYHLTGHGGALNGWRCQRFHSHDARLSAVILFNHESSAYGACLDLMRVALGEAKPLNDVVPVAVDAAWYGDYLDEKTGLSVSLSRASEGHMKCRLGTSAELVRLTSDTLAGNGLTSLERDGDVLHLHRKAEKLVLECKKLVRDDVPNICGRYYCGELDAALVVEKVGSAFYAAFEGFLGKSTMQPVYYAGGDVWLLPCQRSMDAPAPGDWTLVFQRDVKGNVAGIRVGCWLAHNLDYRKI